MSLPPPPWEAQDARPRRRVWPWMVGSVVGLLVVMLLAGGSCYAVARRTANSSGADACAVESYGDQVDGIVLQLRDSRIDRPTAAAKVARVQRTVQSYRAARRFLGGDQKRLVALEGALQAMSLSILVDQPVEPPHEAVRAAVAAFGPCPG